MDTPVTNPEDVRRARLAPLVRSASPLGSLRPFLSDPQQLYLDALRTYGPLFRIRLLTATFVVLAGPEAVRFFQRHERELFTARGLLDPAARMMQVDPEILTVNVDGDVHRRLRRNQKEPMSRGYFERHIEQVAQAAEQFVAGLPDDTSLPVATFAKRLIYRQMGYLMAGEPADELYDAMKTILDGIIDTIIKPWRRALPVPLRVRRAMSQLRRHSEAIRARSAALPADDPNLVQTLLAGVEEGLYSVKDLPVLVAFPYFAGLDTLAHGMAFALYCAMAERHVRPRLQTEIDEAFVDGGIDARMLRGMSVLRGSVMESMRLYPIATSIRRTARRDFVWKGYKVRRGDVVLIGTTVGHRMPEYFPDPDRFDVDRYTAPRNEHRLPGVYQPYGAGAHTCLGAGLADALIALNLAYLFHHFELDCDPPDYHLRVRGIPTPAPVGLRVRLRRRDRPPATG